MFEACDASPSLDRLHPIPTFQQKLVRLCYLVGPSIYQHFTFLQTATYFTCFLLLLKITLFNTVQMYSGAV